MTGAVGDGSEVIRTLYTQESAQEQMESVQPATKGTPPMRSGVRMGTPGLTCQTPRRIHTPDSGALMRKA